MEEREEERWLGRGGGVGGEGRGEKEGGRRSQRERGEAYCHTGQWMKDTVVNLHTLHRALVMTCYDCMLQ